MKKLLALTLAVIMLAAALASCAGGSASSAIGANVRVTSSDAGDAAAWLTDRLGDKLTDRVVLGTDADAYGIDVSDLEDDGYIIRSLGGEIALFARTADGLDRAARKYAKSVEAGIACGDVTYHEGARIKELRLAGRDISSYTIYCEDETYLKNAAAELASRLKTACGAELDVETGEPTAPYILLKYVRDESLRYVGYRWSVGEDGLTIECSVKYRPQSGRAAVRRFLQNKLDWFGLTYGYSDLPPADLIEWNVGESGGETPAFDLCNFGGGEYVRDDPLENNPLTCGPKIDATHGVEYSKLGGGGDWRYTQPCYLDEIFYANSLNDVFNIVENEIAAGKTPGVDDFTTVHLGQPDNFGWCACKKCLAMLAEEGSRAAWILTWANRLSEEVNEEYPGLVYAIFAYMGTNKLPKTIRPNELLTITYCFDMNCSAHPLDGSMCGVEYPRYQVYHGVTEESRANAVMSAEYVEWCEVSDNVLARPYALPDGLQTMTYVRNVWDDLHFLYENGTRGIYWESEIEEYDTGRVFDWLAYELCWDMDMSRERYDAIYDRILRTMYGEDAGPLVREYLDLCGSMHFNGPCVHCWNFFETFSSSINLDLWEKNFDLLFDLTERAEILADSAREQLRADRLSCECIYKGTISSYFPAYNAGDDARVAELCRRYAIIADRMAKYGIDIETDFCKTWDKYITYDRDLEVEAWKIEQTGDAPWLNVSKTREMPERVAAILAEREAEDNGE